MEIINVTLNPNDAGSGFTFTNGNLTINSSTDYRAVRATHGKSSGKWYWEVKMNSGSLSVIMGVSNKNFNVLSISANNINWRAYFGASGSKFPESIPYGTAWVVGNIIGIALDLENGTLEFYKNGVSMGVSHTNVKELGEVYPTLASYHSDTKTVTINFGETPFAYNIPSGFKAYAMYPSHKILISSGDNLMSLKENYKKIVPPLVSNALHGYEVSSSSKYSNANNEPFNAFDGSNTTFPFLTNGSTSGEWLKIKLLKEGKVKRYIMKCADTGQQANGMPISWTIQGSNDDVQWFNVDNVTNEPAWIKGESRSYQIENSSDGAYLYYRILFLANNNYTSYFQIGEWELYEDSGSIVHLNDTSEDSFLRWGIDRNYSVQLNNSINQRLYAASNPAVLGSGKVFKQKIDTTKIPIRSAVIE